MRVSLHGKTEKGFRVITSFQVTDGDLLRLFLEKSLENNKSVEQFMLRIVFSREEVDKLFGKQEEQQNKKKK